MGPPGLQHVHVVRRVDVSALSGSNPPGHGADGAGNARGGHYPGAAPSRSVRWIRPAEGHGAITAQIPDGPPVAQTFPCSDRLVSRAARRARHKPCVSRGDRVRAIWRPGRVRHQPRRGPAGGGDRCFRLLSPGHLPRKPVRETPEARRGSSQPASRELRRWPRSSKGPPPGPTVAPTAAADPDGCCYLGGVTRQ